MDGNEPIRILVILASTGAATETDVPITLAQFAPAYYLFKDRGAEIVLTTYAGEPALFFDLKRSVSQDEAARRFIHDRAARDELADTLLFDQVDIDDFDAAYCLGISGRIWAEQLPGPQAIVASFLQRGKPVAIVPGRTLDLNPSGPGRGLLMIGDVADTPLMAAHALLQIARERKMDVKSTPDT